MENQADYDSGAFTQMQYDEFIQAKQDIVDNGGWGSINIKFEDGKVVMIRHEIIKVYAPRRH